jgi:hypothetical protein
MMPFIRPFGDKSPSYQHGEGEGRREEKAFRIRTDQTTYRRIARISSMRASRNAIRPVWLPT